MDSGRKQRWHVSMDRKLQALKEVSEGKTMSEVALKMGVPYSTVRAWKTKKKQIEEWGVANQMRVDFNKCTTMRTTANERLNDAVFTWFVMARKQEFPINGPLIQKKALDFHKLLGGAENFRASEGWLCGFKQKYGIRLHKMCGEKLYADVSSVEPFTNNLLMLVEEERLSRDQVFNCDETGIYYKILPSKALTGQCEEGLPGSKRNENRVTAMACSNASGSLKLPLMVIGNTDEPEVSQNLKTDNLPVFYRQQSGALMNSTLFKEWFDAEFIPRVSSFLKERGLPRRALLIIDNAPSHLLEDPVRDGIEIMFLPPNVASLVQPMEQGVLDNLKRRYRYQLIMAIDDSLQNGETVVDHLKTITMDNVIFWLAESWNGITSASIRRSWQKIWPESENGQNNFDEPMFTRT